MATSLAPDALASSVAHAGDGVRMGAFASELATGRPLSIAVVGGSISAGSTFTAMRGQKSRWLWHQQFLSWLRVVYPPHNTSDSHTLFNGALPASTPSYVESCISMHVPAATDLVLVEYAANYDDDCSYERLVRRLLSYKRRMAIVLLNMPFFWPKSVPGRALPAESRGFAGVLTRSAESQLTARDLDFS